MNTLGVIGLRVNQTVKEINMVMKKMLFAFVVVVVGVGSLQAQNNCSMNYRTETVDSWGVKPNKDNAGLYLHDNFKRAFPSGLTIGCEHTLTFTSAKSITRFLPADGQSAVLTASAMNPKIKMGDLAGQLVALYLSIGFDSYDEGFTNSKASLGDLVIKRGSFKGWTVAELLVEANNTFGGCASDYSLWELTHSLESVNDNFVEGQLSGDFLVCPRERIAMEVYPFLSEDGTIQTNVNKKTYEFYNMPKVR